MRYPYIIYSPLYRDTNGGAMVLHRLAALLRDAGETVCLWPFDKPAPDARSIRQSTAWMWRRARWSLRGRDVRSPLHIPLAKAADISDSIVVYPEIAAGNPLDANHVVRWVLYKPSRTTADTFGNDECLFYFRPEFHTPGLAATNAQPLYMLDLMHERYGMTNHGPRDAVCYMVRKGSGQPLDKHPPDAKRLDGLSHRTVAKWFNRSRMFISYDPYTLYSRYAAMCGCIPVVVPPAGMDKTTWRPEETGRLGIAYGFEDIDWAVRTRPALLRYLESIDADAKRAVTNFIAVTQSRFARHRLQNTRCHDRRETTSTQGSENG